MLRCYNITMLKGLVLLIAILACQPGSCFDTGYLQRYGIGNYAGSTNLGTPIHIRRIGVNQYQIEDYQSDYNPLNTLFKTPITDTFYGGYETQSFSVETNLGTQIDWY